jgi:hypothetical protein
LDDSVGHVTGRAFLDGSGDTSEGRPVLERVQHGFLYQTGILIAAESPVEPEEHIAVPLHQPLHGIRRI